MIPTNHIAAVFVIFSNDLVRASNILVILTPAKLYAEIVMIPRITKVNKRKLEKTYFRYTRGSYINASLLSL